ncbi:MAG TPA: hypothetical protein VMY18_02295, partial [Acidobacteriota bacterium]|nr:hypothetical protein [Acidobacteriota bacterium]
LLIESTRRTRALLQRDLEIELDRLEKQWHLKSLVQIFVENRIYLRIEKCETWVEVLYEIDRGLEPHLDRLRRPVTEEDLVYLTEVKIRRISAWDSKKAEEELNKIDEEMRKVKKNLRNLTAFTIEYLDNLLARYGKGRERRTRICSFDSVAAVSVVERTEKLYIERNAGFIGTDLKDGEELGPCSPLDDVMVVLQDGGMVIAKVADRKYVGENIVYASLIRPGERDTVFNLIYEDVETGRVYAKRFTVGGYTRERRYELGPAKKKRALLLAVGNGVCAHIKFRKKPRIRTDLYLRFDELLVKGRGAAGNTLTRHRAASAREISEAVYCSRLNLDPSELTKEALSGDTIDEQAAGDGITGTSKPNGTPIDSTQQSADRQKPLFSSD